MPSDKIFGVASSGMNVGQRWLDAISHNIANLNTINPARTEPFRQEHIWVQEAAGNEGAHVSHLYADRSEAQRKYAPEHLGEFYQPPKLDGAGRRAYQTGAIVGVNSTETVELYRDATTDLMYTVDGDVALDDDGNPIQFNETLHLPAWDEKIYAGDLVSTYGTRHSGFLRDDNGEVIIDAYGNPQLDTTTEAALADRNGYITLPVVDLDTQMTDMIVAQRHLQANARVVSSAEETYRSALRIGR